MRSGSTFHPEDTDTALHPATRAWRELGLSSRRPTSIDELRSRKGKPKGKSAVYRLHGAGPAGAPVVAKRARKQSVLVERLVYQDVLPGLPLPAVRCYGALEDGDGSWWLLLEEVVGEPCSPELSTHRALAAQWMSTMHTTTSFLGPDLAGALPGLGPDHHLRLVRSVRAALGVDGERRGLAGPDVDALDRIGRHCAVVEARWPAIERACQVLPPCLVHNDVVGKNLRVAGHGSGAALYVLDWEMAGWGPPLTDLSALDPELYRASLVASRPLGADTVQELALVGTILRQISLIGGWTAFGSISQWTERTVQRLVAYEGRLANSLQVLGWG